MPYDLVKEALTASLHENTSRVSGYPEKLDDLVRRFNSETNPPKDTVIKSRALFNWLWESKPNRYQSGGNYRLTDVINAQLSNDTREVGNCLGLTILYNCLLKTMKIHAGIISLDNAFGRGPHMLTVLQTGQSMIDIEHISPDGFDYKNHRNSLDRKIWGSRELVADIYNSNGNELFHEDKLNEAMIQYDMAVKLNPQHEHYHLNRIILQDRMQTE